MMYAHWHKGRTLLIALTTHGYELELLSDIQGKKRDSERMCTLIGALQHNGFVTSRCTGRAFIVLFDK